MKLCQTCKQLLPLDLYGKNKTRCDGYEYSCKQCSNEYRKQIRKNKPEINSKATKQWYINNKEKVKKHIHDLQLSIPPGVYMVKNIINGKRYIGQSIKPYARRCSHFGISNKTDYLSNSILRDEVRQYGKDKFIFGIVEYCDKEELLIKERYYINLYNPEYNAN
jgi:hypothetical protein